jgi:Uma2 family endonuclease
MTETGIKYTYQDLRNAPEDRQRYELFEGELIVTPSPGTKHQIISSRLFDRINTYVKERNLGRTLYAPLDVYFDEETVVQPDLLFVSTARSSIVEENRIKGAADMIVEILSLRTADRDRGFKFRRYETEGVTEYWIIDPDKAAVEVYTLSTEGFKLYGKYTGNALLTSALFPGLTFPVSELFTS